MNRSVLAKVGVAAVGVAAFVLVNAPASAAIIALISHLRFWSYPVVFLLGLGLIAFVFIILIPPAKKEAVRIAPGWFGRMSAKLRERFMSEDKLAKHGERFSKGHWKFFRDRGPAALVIIVCIVLGPFFGAIAARFLGLTERKAWRYAIIGNALSVVIFVSAYLGAIDWVRTHFFQIFGQ